MRRAVCAVQGRVREAKLCAPFRAQETVSESQLSGIELFILVDILFGCDWF